MGYGVQDWADITGKLGFWTNSAGGKHDWYGGKYLSFKGSETLTGTYTTVEKSLDLDKPESNPRHLMTRFIVRVY